MTAFETFTMAWGCAGLIVMLGVVVDAWTWTRRLDRQERKRARERIGTMGVK